MRILMLIAIVLLVIAVICAAVPTQLAGDKAMFWFFLGMLVWAVDAALGGYVYPVHRRQ